MKFKKILLAGIDEGKLEPAFWKRIDALTEKIVRIPKDSPEMKKQLADADCVLLSLGSKFDKEDIGIAHKLKYIGMLGTGYGRIDTSYAKTKGILVTNVPSYSTEGVAEFVFAILLEHLRDLEKGKQQARRGNYSEFGLLATEIKGKVFGILGLGRIGSRVAEIASGFGADVRYWSRNRKRKIEKKGIKYEDADVLIPKCDFLSLHFALVKDTEKFLNKERVSKIKSGAVVVNTAPMELVDIDALGKRLEKGDIIFILDHSDEMGADGLKKLSKYANCIIYPPGAYLTKESTMSKQVIFVSNIENFLKGTIRNRIN